jgi:hypothetical protein
MGPGGSSSDLRRTDPEADHSLTSSVEIRNAWSFTSALSVFNILFKLVAEEAMALKLFLYAVFFGRQYRTNRIMFALSSE